MVLSYLINILSTSRKCFGRWVLTLFSLFYFTLSFAQIGVPRVGGSGYASFSALVNAKVLQPNDVVELSGEGGVFDITTLDIPLTIRGNGFTLSVPKNSATINLKADLHLINVKFDGGGNKKALTDITKVEPFFLLKNAQLTMDDLSLFTNFVGSTVLALDNSSVVGGRFISNQNVEGQFGVVLLENSSTINRVLFESNTIRNQLNTGVVVLENSSSMANVIVAQNGVAIGTGIPGAIYFVDGTVEAYNCTVVNNTNLYGVSGGVDEAKIYNSILYGNKASEKTATFSVNGYTENPLMNSDYSLQENSPCINAGDDSKYSSDVWGEEDFYGDPRHLGKIDIGACEFPDPSYISISCASLLTFSTSKDATDCSAIYTLEQPKPIGRIRGIYDYYYNTVSETSTYTLWKKGDKVTLTDGDVIYWKAVVRGTDVEGICSQTVKIIDKAAPVLATGKTLPAGRSDIAGLLSDCPAFPTFAEVQALFTDNCGTIVVDSTMKITATDVCSWSVTTTYTVKDAAGNEAAVSPFKVTYSGGDKAFPAITGEVPLSVEALVDHCIFTVPDLTAIVKASASDDATPKAQLSVTQYPKAGSELLYDTYVMVTVADLCGNEIDTTIGVTLPPALTVQITATESHCFGKADGEILGTISGGKAPYTLTWSKDAEILGSEAATEIHLTDLADGTYSILVEDANGCKTTQKAVLAENQEKITVTALDSVKVYDGTPLTQGRYQMTGTLLAGDELKNVKISGEITNHGSVANKVLSFQIMRGEQDVTCYYDTAMVNGTLTVKQREFTIIGGSAKKVYDGLALQSDAYTTEGTLATGEEVTSVHLEGQITNVGKADNLPSLAVIMHDGVDVTGNYLISYKPGILEVTPLAVKVTITGRTGNVTYNGEEQQLTGYKFEPDSKLYQLSDFEFSGDSVAKGTDVNTYLMNIMSKHFTNKNKNFNVTFVANNGWLKIGKLAVTVAITGHTKTVTYNGSEQKVTGYKFAPSNTLYTLADFEYAGDSTAKDTDVDTYAMGLVKANFTNKNTNFDVTFEVEDGWLQIGKLAVTVAITGHTKTVTYNGSEQKVTGYKFAPSNTLYTLADFEYAGDSTAKGTDVDTYAMGLVKANFTNKNTNFDVTFEVEDGWLKIGKLDVIVSITGYTKTLTYNGSEQKVTGYGFTPSNTLYTLADFDYAGDSIAKGTDAGTYTMLLKEEDFTNTNSNFGNVTFHVTNGSLEIVPLDVVVSIVGNGKTTIYNGFLQDTVGYRWSANSKLYTVADFECKRDTFVEASEAGTYYMGLTSADFVNLNPNFGEVTFKVEDGWMVIKKLDVTVTIVGNNETFTFDDNEKEVEGYQWSASTPLYTVNDFLYSGDSIVKGINAGTYYMGLIQSDFKNLNPNFGEVTFEITDGWLLIKKMSVVVTIIGKSKNTAYNGSEQSISGYSWRANSSLYHETDFKFEGDSTVSGTTVGKYYMGLEMSQFTNLNENFDNVFFAVEDGCLNIEKLGVVVTITGNNKTSIYNGKEQDTVGYKWSADSELYLVTDFAYAGDSTVKGTDAKRYEMGLVQSQFTNLNENFGPVKFQITDGWLDIVPLDVKVTITGNNKTTIFNGKEQDTVGYKWSADSKLYLVTDFSYAGDSAVKGIHVGKYDMGLAENQFSNVNPNFGKVTFSIADGWLDIKPLGVTVAITGNNKTTIYNGEEQDTVGYKWKANTTLYQVTDFAYAGDSTAKGTHVGKYDMGLKEADFSNLNSDFAPVKFVVTDGWLNIAPLDVKVTITGNNKTAIFNGKEQDTVGYKWKANTTLYQVTDFAYAGDSTAKGTHVGKYDMGLKASDFSNKNTDFGKVEFIINDGWLKIDQLAVTVSFTGNNKSAIYNGAEQDTFGYRWSATSPLYLVDDFKFTGDSTVAGTDAGNYPMNLKEGQFTNLDEDFKVTFVVVADGFLLIKPLDVVVEIKGNTKEVQYNGLTQQVTGFTFSPNTILYHWEDMAYSGDSLAKGMTIGQYDMDLTSAEFSNVNPNFGKVEFQIVRDGSLTIIPIQKPITITANSSSIVYDGSPLTNESFKYTPNVLAAGDKLSAVLAGTITHVGEVANQVVSYKVTRQEGGVTLDVTENYLFTASVDGKLVVTKRPVLLRSESEERIYNGQPLTNATVKVVGDPTNSGFAEGEGASYQVTGTITNIGSVENEFTYKLRSNTSASDYSITVEFGTLTVTPILESIVITANSKSKIYDGQPLVENGITYAPHVLAKGDTILATLKGEITHVGSTPNQVVKYGVYRGNEEVTQNYTFGTCQDGLLSVEKRHVTLTSATDSKVYDRTPLANDQIAVGADGFAAGEGATYEVPNSITEWGSVENSFTYILTDKTLASDYTIDEIVGTLTVTKRPTAIVFGYGYNVKSDTLGGYADEAYKTPADPIRKGYEFKGWKPALPELLPLDTLPVVAQWLLIDYTVTLDTFNTLTYTVEDKDIDLATHTPVREGYNFMGWVDEKGNEVTSIATSAAKSVALTATWEIATFHINYYSDGKLWKSVPVVYATAVEPSAAPVKVGYLFNGWTPTLPATMPAKDLKVEADWSIITYSLFLVDEGRDAGTITYTVEDSDFYLDKLEERAGQEFVGWVMDGDTLAYDEATERYVFHPNQVASDVTLEAAWQITSSEFTIVYRVDGTKYKSFKITAGAKTKPYISTVKAPKAKEGYSFDGWDIEVPELMPRKNLVVNAVWKANVYKLVLKDENGTVIYNTTYTIEDEVLLPPMSDSEGKRDFLGWSDGVNTYNDFDPKKFLADVEFTALWKLKSFQVIYYVGNDEYARDTLYVGDTIVKLPDPDDYIEGYAFSGWSETPAYMPTKDIKVTSYYERGGYTLTYKSEGKVVKQVRYLYNAPISPSRGVSKYGYEFMYWSGVPDRMPAKDIEVEAVYNVATYYIALINGETSTDTLYYTIYDDDIILPTLDERGKIFRGWYDGKQSITKISTGSYAANLELTANWVYINYSLVFMVDGVQYSKKNNMRCGDKITLPKEPTKANATFVRWDGMPADGLMPDEDLTLTAIFSDMVGESLVEETVPVRLYSADCILHVLHAEGSIVQVVDMKGVTLYRGTATADDFEIPMRYRGTYVVRVKESFKKIVVK